MIEVTVTHALSPSLAEAWMEVIDMLRQRRAGDISRTEVDDLFRGLAELRAKINEMDTAVGRAWATVDALVRSFDKRLLAVETALSAANPKPVEAVQAAQSPRESAATGTTAPASTGSIRLGPEWLTDERRPVLEREWPAGTPVGDIRLTMARLPGPSLPDNQRITIQANRMGLRRPPGHTGTPGILPPDMPPLDAPQPEMAESRAADFDQIASWAIARGIIFDGTNLDEVNRKAASVGVVPFRLRNTTHRRP